MQLSNRLATLTKYVPQGSSVIDVGTDHAYVPIYLIKNNIVTSCMATDINKGPLVKAQQNIDKYRISNIRLKQTSGLQGITEEDGNVIMISGMGGYLIIDILKAAMPVVKAAKRLILQPQQDIDQVRKFLHDNDFKIVTEDFAKDDDKYYTILVVEKGKEAYDKEYEYLFGKCLIEKKLPLFKEWLTKKMKKLEEIKSHLKEKQGEQPAARMIELEKEIAQIKEVIGCLS
nr:class I SAM-dependent methyltransferase [uncultured Cellulosilyticum sp.]